MRLVIAAVLLVIGVVVFSGGWNNYSVGKMDEARADRLAADFQQQLAALREKYGNQLDYAQFDLEANMRAMQTGDWAANAIRDAANRKASANPYFYGSGACLLAGVAALVLARGPKK